MFIDDFKYKVLVYYFFRYSVSDHCDEEKADNHDNW